jgi:ribA/ribD-fused uncharacterized protein
MKYNISSIEEGSKFIFFWGNQPAKDGSITKACFSQWWLSSFVVDGMEYKSAEHWMMARKAELFDDHSGLQKVLACKTPAEAKKIGREILNFDEKTWCDNRYRIVKEGNFHKFSQNSALKSFLLNTRNRVIVEASPVDPIWGIGMAADDPEIQRPSAWKGMNLLGFALMEVRDDLM